MKLNKQDKALLEELDTKYGKDLLASALLQIANGIDHPDEGNDTIVSSKECVLSFIQFLEGTRIRMREIHWETESENIHDTSRNLLFYIDDVEDNIAEQLMGMCGFRIHVGEVIPIMPESTDMESLLKEIKSQTLSVLLSIEGDKEFTAIESRLEDFVQYIDKNRYAITIR